MYSNINSIDEFVNKVRTDQKHELIYIFHIAADLISSTSKQTHSFIS